MRKRFFRERKKTKGNTNRRTPRQIMQEFVFELEKSKASRFEKIAGLTDRARELSELLERNKNFLLKSEIEEAMAEMYIERRKNLSLERHKMMHEVFIRTWLERAAKSAERAGEKQKSKELREKAQQFHDYKGFDLEEID